jgi:hypothetical protein
VDVQISPREATLIKLTYFLDDGLHGNIMKVITKGGGIMNLNWTFGDNLVWDGMGLRRQHISVTAEK